LISGLAPSIFFWAVKIGISTADTILLAEFLYMSRRNSKKEELFWIFLKYCEILEPQQGEANRNLPIWPACLNELGLAMKMVKRNPR
jgi:hypothetical protein